MPKTIIITGASSGIGKALAELYAARKWNVVINGRNQEALLKTEELLKSFGVATLAVSGDVANEEDCKKLVEATIERFGQLDILVNNAGISMRAIFNDTDLGVIKKVMDINFWGTAYCTKYALPHLLKTKGSVVGISSVAGFKGLPGRTGYSASKFAMQGFLEALRIENRKTGLHVLIACPGYTESNIRNTALTSSGKPQRETPLNESKLMKAETVAKAIFDAVEKRQNTLTLTFQGKLLYFLNKFLPNLTDTLVYNAIAKEIDSPFK